MVVQKCALFITYNALMLRERNSSRSLATKNTGSLEPSTQEARAGGCCEFKANTSLIYISSSKPGRATK